MRKGDVLELRAKAKQMIVVRHNIDTLDRSVPQWLDVSVCRPQGHRARAPLARQIEIPVREQLIVELYSK